jgi:2-polyprenyl-3-methyl-5-hydroxy-6-metoxy-1,4-benzoquinol methylase
MKECTVCSSSELSELGVLTPNLDYSAPVYGCACCGSYCVERDAGAYEFLHVTTTSTYSRHALEVEEIVDHYNNKNIEALRDRLIIGPVISAIVGRIESFDAKLNILEQGCSKGSLGAYLIASGHNYTGVDVSPTAIEEATKKFGEKFFLAGDPVIEQNGPYDLVFHISTIGCVESPLSFIRSNLSMLREGGELLFNAPNVNACKRFGDIWLTQTTPPDLVTLFDPSIWVERFSDLAAVSVTVLPERPAASLRKLWRKKSTGTTLMAPVMTISGQDPAADSETADSGENRFISMFKKIVLSCVSAILRDSVPAEFGVIVKMTKLN